MPARPRPFLVLAILDGWGFSPQREGNAIASCATDHMRGLMDRYPTTLLDASGEAVGLPDGVMGNSEVGHLTIGAGSVVNQDVTAINKAIREGQLPRNEVLTAAMDRARQGDGTVHFLGLASDASVHSNLAHLRELVKLAATRGAGRVRVHAFTDGRDTSPTSGRGYLEELEAFLREAHPDAAVATVEGRYYAMDRDTRWDRVEKAWQALVLGEGHRAPSGTAAVEQAYQRGETDEFILPTVVDGLSHASIADGDVVIFFNFRPDRAREMTRALTEDEFDGFPRPEKPALAGYVCFTSYDASFDLPVAFRPRKPDMVLGRLFSELGHTQLRIAETEKYAHVTYFLNGGVERTYPGEDRVLIPSPRVATYDLQPEMSAPVVTERMLERMRAAETDVIVINYANADMVGHTGDFAATLAACEVVDRAVGRIHAAAREAGALLAVTGDHGNAEQMLDPQTGGVMTAHTTNPVPFILAREDLIGLRLSEGGGLSSLLPTILTALDIEAPVEMDGRSLA
jgi:2,3-bisphosphoglycerate-independent phosphoglycerate mutase